MENWIMWGKYLRIGIAKGLVYCADVIGCAYAGLWNGIVDYCM